MASAECVPRSPPKLSTASHPLPLTHRLRITSFAITGLHGLLEKDEGAARLRALFDVEQPDVLCLEVIKVQSHLVPELEARLRAILPEFSAHFWACSTDAPGQAGILVMTKGPPHSNVNGVERTLDARCSGTRNHAGGALLSVHAGLTPEATHRGAGRVVTLVFERLTLVVL